MVPDDAISAPKLASVVARSIEDDVAALGWPVGTVLGSEADLLARYGVSRAVLREAVRILEHTGAAAMRRGPGGGLVVSEPDRGAVVTAMGLWFSYVRSTIGEMLEVRRPLVAGAVGLAAERRTDADVREMHAAIDRVASQSSLGPPDLLELEGIIVAAAANPALALFVDSVGDLGATRLANGGALLDPRPTDDDMRRHMDRYRVIVASIADGDGAGAAGMMERLVDAVSGRLTDGTPAPRPSAAYDTDGKLAERVARALRDDIEVAGWPIGEVLGSEGELVERHGVSRTILREAVRILEHHGAVRTKRGPRGGLLVSRPDHSAIVRSARLVLDYAGVTAAQLVEVRSILEVAAARVAATRISTVSAAAIRAAVEAESATAAAEHFMPVHHEIAAATGNRLFGLFIDVLGELVPSRVRPEQRSADGLAALSVDVHHAHARIAEAVLDGDVDLAERRMLRHLQASVGVLE